MICALSERQIFAEALKLADWADGDAMQTAALASRITRHVLRASEKISATRLDKQADQIEAEVSPIVVPATAPLEISQDADRTSPQPERHGH